jgi:asparagine synthase (glutamine-hydrolysing)
MCGIAGIVNPAADSVVEADTIHQMCQVITHRGPDDEGIYTSAGVGLGIRRLSIIDLSGGRQPVHNEEKTIWVVFNGEIYNFRELRKELEGKGHRFYTHTDTEVIVHLYEDMGADCVQKLRGMFGIALYDQPRRYLLLARDRLGKKPLHYSLVSQELLFGSEIKSLLAVRPGLGEVDREALLQYFYFGYIPDPGTAFRRIRKLPPGYLLEFMNGYMSVRPYWDLPRYGAAEPKSEQEYLEQFENKLDEAVRLRLVSDVPLGALLSGGIDSSTVVALMARASSKPVKSFSIGFSREDFNEASAARAVAARFGTEHHELIVEPNIEEALELLSHSLEEPFADSSIIPTYYVSRLTREHVTVALSGDGGDELFAGYLRYAVGLKRRAFDHVPAWARQWYRGRIHPRLPSSFLGRGFAYNAALPGCDRYLDSVSFLPAFDREHAFFSDEFLASFETTSQPLRNFQGYFNNARAEDFLSRLLYMDTKTYLAGDILTKVDRMSMRASLEVRAPLLDHEVVEWATRLPVAMKFRDGQGKYLLRKLAERVGVPSEILLRPKQGFALPLVHWLRDGLGDLLSILVEPRTLARGYFKPAAVRTLLDEHRRKRRDHSAQIWMLLMFELWHRNFLASLPDSSVSKSHSKPVLQAGALKQQAVSSRM